MKCNYVAPIIILRLFDCDVITTSGKPEGVDYFDVGWLSE